MNCVEREIKKFAGTISEEELERNHVLRSKLKRLLLKAELVASQVNELKSIRVDAKKFLHHEFLNQ